MRRGRRAFKSLRRVLYPQTQLSLRTIRDATTGQVIRGELDRHLVPWEDLDEVHPHLPRDVREHFMAVLQLHAKHRVRQWLDDRPFDFNDLFFRHGYLYVAVQCAASTSFASRSPFGYRARPFAVLRARPLTQVQSALAVPRFVVREGGTVYMFNFAESSRRNRPSLH